MKNNSKIQKIGLFEISVIAFFYILPAISIATEYLYDKSSIIYTAVKWILFWGVGMRLFTCGLKQAIQPAFTAKSIFDIREEKAYSIVRELGFANISTGLCGILSLFYGGFRGAVWVIGLIYYMLALIQHTVRKEKNASERFVTITDFTIVLELIISGLLLANR